MIDSTAITQKLRFQLTTEAMSMGIGVTTALFKKILAECDRIDELYTALENKCAETQAFADRIYKVLGDECTELQSFVKQLYDAAEERKEVDLWGVTYTTLPIDNMALPLDADDMVTHIGDKIDGYDGETVYVMGVSKDGAFYYSDTKQEIRHIWSADLHHHEPTIADVLREFANEWANTDIGDPKEDEIIERYTKRLRLANDDKNQG